MNRTNGSKNTLCSNADLAEMVFRVAQAARADAIICTTETGAFAQIVNTLSKGLRVIAATTNKETYNVMTQAGLEVIRLPFRAIDKYHQVRHIASIALRSKKVSIGNIVVCALGCHVYHQEGKLIVVADVEPTLEYVAVSDFLKLTDGIRPNVLEAAVDVACKIGRTTRSRKHIGAILMLGDSLKVLEDSKQLIPNPFQGHDHASRNLTNPDIHDAIIELSKLDGAFVVRGDGFIQTAGTFLATFNADIELPAGLGARHFAAAAVTKRTAATAIVVSATDGHVRAYSGGMLVLQIDPEVSYGPVTTDE
jgi:DNA integrity scanning protein DisA with diadenylate cyclase activity